MKKAFLIISHGSHSQKLEGEVQVLVNKLKSLTDFPICEYAFLEITQPSISDGIRNCVKQGATEIKVLLNFLNSGRHVDQDIPRIVEESKKEFPQVKITISKPVGQHDKIPQLFTDLL